MQPDKKSEFLKLLGKLYKYIQSRLKIKTTPKIVLSTDKSNSNKILGKTAYYDPNKNLIKLYIDSRHPKDILRSFAHECIHLYQHENKMFGIDDVVTNTDPKYAQNNPELRKAEKQAYLMGNMFFRDFCDSHMYDT